MSLAPADDQGLADKVAALRLPQTYPEPSGAIDEVQTHMSWVFLTEQHAYKLKKPVRHDYLDFSTLAERERYCREELRLNRRLAPGVYLDVVALRRDAQGALRLAGQGEPVEWLVQMRRLPASQMLDRRIRAGTVGDAELGELGAILAAFYAEAPREACSAEAYVADAGSAVRQNLHLLGDSRFELDAGWSEGVHARLLDALARHRAAMGRRAAHVIEAHGDLRPEHICLISPPVIYDRLEFNRRFRLLDPVEELCYFAMECERLGAAAIGERLLQEYLARSGDDPPAPLRHWYMGYRACLRARLAARHILDLPREDWRRWLDDARAYLQIADRHVLAACVA